MERLMLTIEKPTTTTMPADLLDHAAAPPLEAHPTAVRFFLSGS